MWFLPSSATTTKRLTKGGKYMSETDTAPGSQNLSALYVSENLHEIEIFGVKIKLKEIPGPEYMRLTNRCIMQKGGQEVLDREKYAVQLIKAMVAEPKDLDVNKLNGGALAQLLIQSEKFIGVSEDVLKNLEVK